MTIELTPTQRRSLRARAHALHATVMVGEAGLTPAVLTEIKNGLSTRDLIKVRALTADRATRARWLAEICVEFDAAPVQLIGKMLVVYRPLKAEGETVSPQKPRRPARPKPARRTKRSFQSD